MVTSNNIYAGMACLAVSKGAPLAASASESGGTHMASFRCSFIHSLSVCSGSRVLPLFAFTFLLPTHLALAAALAPTPSHSTLRAVRVSARRLKGSGAPPYLEEGAGARQRHTVHDDRPHLDRIDHLQPA